MHFTGGKPSPLDSVVVKTKKLLSSDGDFLTNAVHHHRENNLIKLTHHEQTRKNGHDSQIGRARNCLPRLPDLSNQGLSKCYNSVETIRP